MRNLIEFTKGEQDSEYMKLTSLLHWKDDSGSITLNMVCDIYANLFGSRQAITDGTRLVTDIIDEEALLCLSAADGLNFENKVVLSMAIRLAAEKFMFSKISDPAACGAVRNNQTYNFLRLYKGKVPVGHPSLKVIERVVLMTPENIHLNSFMYEPILDMSDEHLRRIYGEVKTLT